MFTAKDIDLINKSFKNVHRDFCASGVGTLNYTIDNCPIHLAKGLHNGYSAQYCGADFMSPAYTGKSLIAVIKKCIKAENKFQAKLVAEMKEN